VIDLRRPGFPASVPVVPAAPACGVRAGELRRREPGVHALENVPVFFDPNVSDIRSPERLSRFALRRSHLASVAPDPLKRIPFNRSRRRSRISGSRPGFSGQERSALRAGRKFVSVLLSILKFLVSDIPAALRLVVYEDDDKADKLRRRPVVPPSPVRPTVKPRRRAGSFPPFPLYLPTFPAYLLRRPAVSP
jgi:hypothetical protein